MCRFQLSPLMVPLRPAWENVPVASRVDITGQYIIRVGGRILADLSPSCSAKVKNGWKTTSTPSCAFMAFAQNGGSKTEGRRLGLAVATAFHGDLTQEAWTCRQSKFRGWMDIKLKLQQSVSKCDYSNVLRLENCAVPGSYAANSGNSLTTFRNNLSALASRAKNLLRLHDSPNLNHSV